MARTHEVTSARQTKDGHRPTCVTCRQPIEVGQSYKWNQPNRFSIKLNWHSTCLGPRASALESNEKRSQAMQAFENAYDALDTLDPDDYVTVVDEADKGDTFDADRVVSDLEDICSTCEGEVQEAAEMWRESASNIEDGFGHSTFASDEMNEHADVYDDVASEAGQAASSINPFELADYSEAEGDPADGFRAWFEEVVQQVRDELESAEGSID